METADCEAAVCVVWFAIYNIFMLELLEADPGVWATAVAANVAIVAECVGIPSAANEHRTWQTNRLMGMSPLLQVRNWDEKLMMFTRLCQISGRSAP